MKHVLLLLSLLLPAISFAQKDSPKTFDPEHPFPDGVYVSFQQLIGYKPGILPNQLLTRNEKNERVKQWFRGDSLYFTGLHEKKQQIKFDSIYAFVDNGDVYIQRRGFGHKVSIIGKLCYFSETYPVKNAPLSPVTIDLAKDVIPHMLNLETGELLEYSVSSMQDFLKEKDTDLYNEYTALETYKLKRNLLLRFIEKYNEKHPLPNKGNL